MMEKLDQEILRWIAAHNSDAALGDHLEAASVKKRDYMRTGFFTYFEPQPDLPPVDSAIKPTCPHISSPELMDGAGSTLFLRNGQLHYLEIYSRGGFIPEELEDFQLGDAG
ncbi:MAG: hypothetical protein QGH46_04615 [Gammaproteobacteria bacterium]|jgi:hypothetical protein|nr:hypothetical protein [Gammaproteobacteria bacterium]